MKIYIPIFLLLGIVFPTIAGEKINIRNISNPSMVKLLALGEVTDLNKIKTSFEKNRWIKIYKVPSDNQADCFPESHGICQYEYYLATAQLDDSPAVNAWYLGPLGEIVNYQWLKTDKIDTAIFNLKVSKYSMQAVRYNKNLKNKFNTYQIMVNNTGVIIN